jgi:Arc/MetJ-type ribon-helix-helix transcriptional regulator
MGLAGIWRLDLYGASAIYVLHTLHMKILTVRLPDALVAEIEAEARRRMISKSDVVRERLTRPGGKRGAAALDAIADLVGSIEGLPADLSESKKAP